MTVAAGFVYDGGILFCVDTKISTDIKTEESKLVHCSFGNGACAITFAISGGDLKFAKSAIEYCEDAVAKVDFGDTSVNIEAVRRTVQSALAKFYRQHVFPHPDRGIGGPVDFAFLIGIWLNGETRLFISRETMLSHVAEYECLGTGAHLAVYLIRQYRKATRNANTLQDVGLIASFAVNRAMDYVESVGGKAEMFVMRNGGGFGVGCNAEIYPGQDFIDTLQSLAWGLVHDLAKVTSNFEVQTARLLEEHFARVRSLNDSRAFLFEALDTAKERDPNFWD
jgi:hypothetical protein